MFMIQICFDLMFYNLLSANLVSLKVHISITIFFQYILQQTCATLTNVFEIYCKTNIFIELI